MSKITLDAETAAKFNGLMERTELCDPSGNLIAYLMPVYEDLSHVVLPGPDPLNDEECAEYFSQHPPTAGITTSELIRRLRSL